ARQRQHAERLRPAPVVADAHAEDAAERAPGRKPEVPRLEVALLEMLVRALGVEILMAGQMHLAVLADDAAPLVHQDRRVEVIALRRELGVAEAHGHAGSLRFLEE